MSLETTRKILYGTLTKFIDQKKFFGKKDYQYITLLSLFTEALEYAYKQYNNGDTSQFTKIEVLQKKIQKLKYECSEICNVKDEFIISETNNPPVIEDLLITLPIINEYTSYKYPEFIGDIYDYDNDGIERVWLEYSDLNLDLSIEGDKNDVKETDVYSVRLKSIENFVYLAKNIYLDDGTCETEILEVHKDDYDLVYNKGYYVTEIADASIVFEKVNNVGKSKVLVPYTNLGKHYDQNIRFVAKQNASAKTRGLISEPGTTTFRFYKPCGRVPDCEGFQNEVIFDHFIKKRNLTKEDISAQDYGSIMITEVSNNDTNYLAYKGRKVTKDMLPLYVASERISDLSYMVEIKEIGFTSISFKYRMAYPNEINYCNKGNALTIKKRKHINPIVSVVNNEECCSNVAIWEDGEEYKCSTSETEFKPID